nr:PREDICTED: uncharacterized protein LOC109034505 [Bemisia tabaci]
MLFLLIVATALVGANANTTTPATSTTTNGVEPSIAALDSLNAIESDPYDSVDMIDNATTISHFMVTPTSSNCKNLDFNWAISEVQGKVEFHGEFCMPSTDSWSLATNVKLKILGYSLLNDKYHFSPQYSEVRKKINLLAAKIDVTLGVYNYCIRIVGNACYWAGKYRCADIYEQPYCFKKNLIKKSTYTGAVNYNDVLQPSLSNYAATSSWAVGGDDCPARLKKIAALANL